MASPQAIIVRTAGGGGGSAAGLLLLLVAIVGLLALFSGNLEKWIKAVGAPAGGPEGLRGGTAAGSFDAGAAGALGSGSFGEVQPLPGGAG